MEHLLHYVWKHKLFPLKVLQTTNGLPVEVIDPGLQNPNAGPDFFNAKLKIDGALWVGNIEIHTHSSDWFRHGHHSDKTYDSVILHVVSEADTETVNRYRNCYLPVRKMCNCITTNFVSRIIIRLAIPSLPLFPNLPFIPG